MVPMSLPKPIDSKIHQQIWINISYDKKDTKDLKNDGNEN